MTFDDFDYIRDAYGGFTNIGQAGRISGWFTLQKYKMQTGNQVKFAEQVAKAMAARRRVYDEIVRTVSAQVESEATIRGLMERHAQLQSASAPPQLYGGPQRTLPGNSAPPQLYSGPQAALPGTATPPVSTYVSDQEIQDAALSAAVGYSGATDKQKYWTEVESRLRAKKWPDATVAEVLQIAAEVVRRTGG